MALNDYLAGEIAQDYADGLLSRREALRRLGLFGLTLTSASALLAACGGDDKKTSSASTTTPSTAAGTPTSAGGSTSTSPAGKKAQLITFAGPNGELQGAFAAAADPRATILVIHENRGLTPHFYDVVGRLSNDGYAALCVDLASAKGGTAKLDEAQVQAALSQTSTPQLVADLGAGITELQKRVPNKKTGTVGFCFGGGMVWNLLQNKEQRLSAAVPFYGPAPDAPNFTGDKAAVLAIYGALDDRVLATKDRAEAALKAAGLPFEIKVYEGANHAFFNDTGPRYNAKAASEANTAMLDWFKKYL